MTRDVSSGLLLGLNNRLPLTRMETTLAGVSAAWLRVACNIDLTANGFVRRRAGFAAAVAGTWHSIWADALGAYGVCNGDLGCIAPRTLARTVVVPGVGQGRLSFERLPDGLVYWTNGERIGRLDGPAPCALMTPRPNLVPLASPILSTPLPSTPCSTTAVPRMPGWSKKLTGTRVMSEPTEKPGQ